MQMGRGASQDNAVVTRPRNPSMVHRVRPDGPAPEKLYHTTPASNRPRILEEGLLPQRGVMTPGDRPEAVYGFSNPFDAFTWSMGNDKHDIWEIVLSSTTDQVEHDDTADNAWFCRQVIAPERLRLLSSDEVQASVKAYFDQPKD